MAFGGAASGFEPRDRAFLHELCYGVARHRGRLDHLLARKVHRGLDSLQPRVLEILRLGAYQVLYMDGVPAYAAISEAVDLAKEAGGQAMGGLVNAVLRAVSRDGDDLAHFPAAAADPAGFLSTWGSHPRWLVERWLQRWSFGEVEALVRADNQRAGVCLVPLDVTPEVALGVLREAGVDAQPVGEGTRCLALAPGSSPLQALTALPSVVQDPAANLVIQYADVPAGTKVADLCAAPGGKALALSRGAVYTVAADRSERRMRLVKENVTRAGGSVGLVVADARKPPFQEMGAVLLDVPCSGTGTLKRHPDGRWRVTPQQIQELATLQGTFLEAAGHCVEPGGVLVYSTCTLEPEENEEQVQAFLQRNEDFQVAPTDGVPRRFLTSEGYLRVLPQDFGFDGAFAARLRRRA